MVVVNPIDVRAATIQAVTGEPNSYKLIQPQDIFGEHERTIVAIIKVKRTNPREIQGTSAVRSEPRRFARRASYRRKECCSISARLMGRVPYWRLQKL